MPSKSSNPLKIVWRLKTSEPPDLPFSKNFKSSWYRRRKLGYQQLPFPIAEELVSCRRDFPNQQWHSISIWQLRTMTAFITNIRDVLVRKLIEWQHLRSFALRTSLEDDVGIENQGLLVAV